MKPETQNDKSLARENADARIDHAAERARQGASDAVNWTRDKVDTAADRAEEGLRRAVDAGAHGAHRVADKAGEWRERGAELASGARDRAGQALENLRARVREKPMESVAFALAAGWLAGRLLKSRN
ncbi:MAG: hypothetical protein OJF55_002536 [Rhodanobacteraceae bacterium]|jgi:ElaB/YqjD/DUF883 family membrane-anchored ribosome-binding protein|nr:MAG: hypothetical protein OJF55_002536 [Rhodanobacteraceae bacterium]